MTAPTGQERRAQLHDAAEAYFNDLTHDVKYADGMETYRNAEKNLQSVIYRRFNILPGNDDCLKNAHEYWTEREKEVLFHNAQNIFEPLLPKAAEIHFLARFYELLDRETLNKVIIRYTH